MAEFPAIPIWTDSFIADTVHCSAEEVGVYIRIIIASWRTRECTLPDNDQRLALIAGVSLKKWKAMRPDIARFFTISNGAWSQKKLLEVRENVRGLSQRGVAAAEARWNAKALRDKEVADAQALLKQCQNDATKTKTKTKEEEEEEGKPSSVYLPDFDACISHFNSLAQTVGWAQVQKMTPPRKAALTNRIKDHGSFEAWCEAMTRASSSPLLTGQTGRGWSADFDWLQKPANFTKLMEGNYDPRQEPKLTAINGGLNDRIKTDIALKEYARRLSAGEINPRPDPSDPFAGR